MTDPTRETTAQMLGLEEPPSSFPSVPDGSGTMFDRIAKDYDRLNRIISLGLDKAWRRKLVRAATRGGGTLFLDLATGTADVAIALAGATPHGRVVGLDPSLGMLQVGREKVDARDWTDRITLVEGDAQALPFGDGAFDAVTMSFGIRNIPDRALALREMLRVLRPGGTLAILELGEPSRGWFSPVARWHVHTVVPWLGARLSGEAEYRYLHESIASFPRPATFVEHLESAGFIDVRFRAMWMDVAHLYVARV